MKLERHSESFGWDFLESRHDVEELNRERAGPLAGRSQDIQGVVIPNQPHT